MKWYEDGRSARYLISNYSVTANSLVGLVVRRTNETTNGSHIISPYKRYQYNTRKQEGFFSLRSVELNYKPLPFSYIEFSILSLCTLSNGRYKATLFQCVYSIYPRVNMFCWLNSIQRFQFFVNIHRTSIPTIYTP